MGLLFRLFIFIIIAGFFVFLIRYGHAESLSPEVFPADYTAADLAPVSPSTPTPRGGVSMNIENLPRVSPSLVLTPTTPRLSTLNAPAPRPLVAEETLPTAPTGLAALAGYGLLTGAQSLGDDLWAGAERTRLDELLASLSATPPADATLRALVVQALLSAAAAPAQPDNMLRPHWLLARAQALFALGEARAAASLLQAAVGRQGVQAELLAGNPAGLLLFTQTQLLAGRFAAVCPGAGAQASAAVSGTALATGWRHAVLVCQGLNGQTEAMQLSLNALGTPPKNLAALVQGIVRGQATPVSLTAPVHWPEAALLAAYPALLNPTHVLHVPDLVAARLVRTPTLPTALRTAAAEVLARDAPGQTALTELYAAFEFAPAERAAPVESAKLLPGPQARALLFQTAANTSVLASLRQAAWLHFMQGLPPQLGHLAALRPPGLPLAGNPALLTTLVRQALLNGTDVQPLLAADPSFTLPATPALVVQLVAGEKGPDSTRWLTWLAGLDVADTAAPRVVAVAQALGHTVPPEVWGAIAKRPAEQENWVAAQALQASLHSAGRGETLLASAAAAGAVAAHQWPTPLLAALVEKLRTAGLPSAARALAVAGVWPPAAVVPAAPAVSVNAAKRPPQRAQQIGGGAQPLPLAPPSRGTALGQELPPPRAR